MTELQLSDFETMSIPEREAQMAKVHEALVGEQPIIDEPLPTAVTLFRGVFSNSRWYQEAHVKELTGADEEGIARMMNAANPAAFLDATTVYGVASLGPHDFASLPPVERLDLLDTLLIGEKELLFLNVLRVTYGDTRKVGMKCPTCGEENDVSFSITEDIPMRKIEFDALQPSFEFTCRDGTNIEYRLVTGADQAEASKRVNITVPELNTILLSKIIVSVNGRPVLDPTHYAKNMGAADRRNLLTELTDRRVGPYFEEVKVPCAGCGVESDFSISWADLL